MFRFSDSERQELLSIARKSLEAGVKHSHPFSPNIDQYHGILAENGASFCTLRIAGTLRGCIGTLEPQRPLVLDVAENAFSAGFRDYRFSKLKEHELRLVHIEISVLGKMVALKPMDDDTLKEYLQDRRPGLVVKKGLKKGTFLPSVWNSLPNAEDFIHELKRKAGLDSREDSLNLEYYEYFVEKFQEE